MNPATVLFAIEAGVRVGRKMNDVLVDSTAERPLLLPLGDLFGDVATNQAVAWFSRPENRTLVSAGGPYADLPREQWLDAYRTLLEIDQHYAADGSLAQARQIIEGLHEFEQLKKGFGARPALQRILGTVVEIGIDWFGANPQALGRDSASRRIVHGFLLRLDEIDFAEDAAAELAGDVLGAALETLGGDPGLLSDDERLHALLGGVTTAIIGEVRTAGGAAELFRRRQLVRRIGPAVLSGGARAFATHSALFLPAGLRAKPLVHSAMQQVLAGIDGRETLFGNETIEQLFHSALAAVGETAGRCPDQAVVQQLIQRTIAVLTSETGAELFEPGAVPAVVAGALEVFAQNVGTLIDPDSPEEQALAKAAAALVAGLSDRLAGDGKVRSLLSKRQLIELSRTVFEQVARDPAALLGGATGTPARTVLAQVIGSVAGALEAVPARLLSGHGVGQLIEIALRTTVQNAPRLLDLDHDDPRTNTLYGIVQQLASALIRAPATGLRPGEDLFLRMAQRLLPIASANVAALLDGRGPVIETTVDAALDLARDTLAGRINAENLPMLAGALLRAVLWDELDLDDEAALLRTATAILRAA